MPTSNPLTYILNSLHFNVPSCGSSQEGEEGLDEDEIEMYKRLLPRSLASLPGGGLKGGILSVSDQQQGFNVEIIISHEVRGNPRPWHIFEMLHHHWVALSDPPAYPHC